MINEDVFLIIKELRRWIEVQTGENLNCSNFDNLIRSRILTSIQMFNLIYYIEDLRGVIIDDSELTTNNLSSLYSIATNLIYPYVKTGD